jgi:hypothetical protein
MPVTLAHRVGDRVVLPLHQRKSDVALINNATYSHFQYRHAPHLTPLETAVFRRRPEITRAHIEVGPMKNLYLSATNGLPLAGEVAISAAPVALPRLPDRKR